MSDTIAITTTLLGGAVTGLIGKIVFDWLKNRSNGSKNGICPITHLSPAKVCDMIEKIERVVDKNRECLQETGKRELRMADLLQQILFEARSQNKLLEKLFDKVFENKPQSHA